MAFIPIPNAIELVIVQSMFGQQINNVFGLDYGAAPDTVDLTVIAGNAITAWINNFAPIFSVDLDLNAVRATSLESASAPSVLVPAPTGTDGEIAQVSVPLNTALVVSSRTDSRGRSYRGRSYFAGVPETARVNAGAVSETYLADLLTAFEGFFTELLLGTIIEHVVLSRYADNAPRVTGVSTPVTAISGNVDFDSQRRRLFGRGA